MGARTTKDFFRKQLSSYPKKYDADYFEVEAAPDCCPVCEAKANKMVLIATATEDDYPPFHKECRCAIGPRAEGDEVGSLAKQKARYASGEFPMKRCIHCKEWTEGNSLVCSKCGKPQ